ncbi:DMT family transporter [Tropicimonas sp. S265A]|uniref:DMT family transporter n=1 Tax=Tropicimonas sp. S265A TaxID=3415134 RepID=UPI003C7BB385
MQKTLSARAWAELLLLSLIWGGSFLAIRTALDEIPFVTSVAYRVAFAAVALLIWLRISGQALPRAPGLWAKFAVMGLLNNVVPFLLMAWGQLHIPIGLTAILNATTAVFGVLVAALVFADERLTPKRIIGVGLGFAGVITAIGIENLLAFSVTSLAQIAVLAGTVSYACAGAWARGQLGGVAPVVAATCMLVASTAVMVPIALVVDGAPSLPRHPATYAAVAYYALIATAFAYLLYYRVLGMAGSGNVLLCTLMVVPVSITLGALVRSETLGASDYVGFALLALGLLVLDGRLTRRLLSA